MLTFEALQARLIASVNARIHNGEFSERALARLVGISQPQLHNVLKGARRLHVPLADAFLAKLHISLLDLLSSEELLFVEDPSPDFLLSEMRRLRLLRKSSSPTPAKPRSKREAG